PQNMIIGSLSQIPYGVFAAALSPVALGGLAVTIAMIALAYRSEFLVRETLRGEETSVRYNRKLVWRAVLVAAAMVVAFFVGIAPAKVAIAGGAVLLLTPRLRPERIYLEIDWPLLMMFCGLFVVVAGVEAKLLTPGMIAAVGRLHLEETALLSGLTAALS